MKLEVNFYDMEEAAADVLFYQTIDSGLRIARQSNGKPRISFRNHQGPIESYIHGDLPRGDDTSQSSIGAGQTLVLYNKDKSLQTVKPQMSMDTPSLVATIPWIVVAMAEAQDPTNASV